MPRLQSSGNLAAGTAFGLTLVAFSLLTLKARIADEIVRDRNVNAGLMECAVALGVGARILFVF